MHLPKKILLVEDNPAIEHALRQQLSAIGGLEVVHAAATAAEASEWLAGGSADWDLAVIDIFLRQGHGFDVLKRCANRAPERRAVMLTNYTRDPVRSSAEALGADAVFDKTSELDAFIAYCAKFAAQHCEEPVPA